jgi:hypothetical protein
VRTLKLNTMKTKIEMYFFHKYLLPNADYHPFGDLEFELSFIPVQFHSMYRRVASREYEELPF